MTLNLFYKPKRLIKHKHFSIKTRLCITLALITALNSSSKSLCEDRNNFRSFTDVVNYLAIADNFKRKEDTMLLSYKSYNLIDTPQIAEDNLQNTPQVSEYNFDLDFSDMPVNDGSIESSLAIVNYTRDMLKDIPNDVKLFYVLNHFNITLEEFDTIQAVVGKEAKPGDNRYEDAFAVITAVYNRMRSYTVSGYVSSWTGKENISIYDHIVAPKQFSPYGDGKYEELLGNTEGEYYQAVLDFLYTADRSPEYMHFCMNFLSSNYKSSTRAQFVNGGNNYFNHLEDNDIIPLEERYYNTNNTIIDNNRRLVLAMK